MSRGACAARSGAGGKEQGAGKEAPASEEPWTFQEEELNVRWLEGAGGSSCVLSTRASPLLSPGLGAE